MMRLIASCFALLASFSVSAQDSISNLNPSVSARIGVVGASCTPAYDIGMTSTGTQIVCHGGVWIAQDVLDKDRVSEYYNVQASDADTTKVLIAYCPVGWKVVGGDCNFDGSTPVHKNVLGHTDGDRGMWCFFAFSVVVLPQGVQTTADCVKVN